MSCWKRLFQFLYQRQEGGKIRWNEESFEVNLKEVSTNGDRGAHKQID